MPKRLMILLLSFSAFTLSFPQDSLNIRYVGSWEITDDFISGGIWNFGVYNGYLYISGGFRDVDESGDTVLYHFIVVDVHNPTDPFVVSKYRMHPLSFYLLDGFLYTVKENRLLIMDVRDPFVVDTVVEYDSIGGMDSPFEGDGRVYVPVVYDNGYYLLDATDVYSPELLCRLHEFKPDTEWGADPDWHGISYGYTLAVDYPYVYVGELKEGQGSEWDPYADAYRHVAVWDSLFIYRYDVRDLSAEPKMCVVEEEMGKMVASGGVILILLDRTRGSLVIYSGEDSLEVMGYTHEAYGNFKCACEDTFYFNYTDGKGVCALKYAGGIDFDSIGYYNDEDAFECGENVGGSFAVENGKIYVPVVDYISDMEFKSMRIYEWVGSDIEEYADVKGAGGVVLYGNYLVNRFGCDLYMYDLSGHLIRDIPEGDKQIYVGNYPSGIYFLRSADGRLNKKVVIIH